MAKNDWARNAFRKAQNLMSKGYNDFEPTTVVSKNDLSNLKNTLLDEEATQPANGWTNLDTPMYPSHLETPEENIRKYPPHLDSSNPILKASEDAFSRAGVTHAFTEEDPIEDLEETLDELDDDTDEFNKFTADAFSKWEKRYDNPDAPALTKEQALQGANLASREINRLKTTLKKAKNSAKELIQDRIDKVTNIKDRLTQ